MSDPAASILTFFNPADVLSEAPRETFVALRVFVLLLLGNLTMHSNPRLFSCSCSLQRNNLAIGSNSFVCLHTLSLPSLALVHEVQSGQ